MLLVLSCCSSARVIAWSLLFCGPLSPLRLFNHIYPSCFSLRLFLYQRAPLSTSAGLALWLPRLRPLLLLSISLHVSPLLFLRAYSVFILGRSFHSSFYYPASVRFFWSPPLSLHHHGERPEGLLRPLPAFLCALAVNLFMTLTLLFLIVAPPSCFIHAVISLTFFFFPAPVLPGSSILTYDRFPSSRSVHRSFR